MNVLPNVSLFATDFLTSPRQTLHHVSLDGQAALSKFAQAEIRYAMECEDAVLLDPQGLATLQGHVRVEILVETHADDLESYFFDIPFSVRGCRDRTALPALASAPTRHLLVVNYVDRTVDWDDVVAKVARIRGVASDSLVLHSYRCAEIAVKKVEIRDFVQSALRPAAL